MEIREIEKIIPNGFHDALLESISVDYLKKNAVFNLQLCIGDPYSEDMKKHDAYRRGCLRLHGLLYCAIEPPDSAYPYCETKTLRIDAGSLGTPGIPVKLRLPEPLPEGAFAHWFFVQEWNSFIYVAATDAQFIWI